MKRQMKLFIGSALLVMMVVSGCAHRGPVLLTNIEYLAPQGIAEAKPKVVGLSLLKDVRNQPESIIGKSSTVDKTVENDLIVQGTVSNLVTGKLREALKARNMAIQDTSWDLSAEGIKANGAGLLFGGEIKKLWMDSEFRALKATTKITVQLRIVVADAVTKKIIQAKEVNSTIERTDVALSASTAERAVSEALSSAINQIFEDEEVNNVLQ